MSLGHLSQVSIKTNVLRLSRTRLRYFAHHLRQLHRPLVQDADLAVCFFLALRDAGDFVKDLEAGGLGREFRKFTQALVEFGGLEPFREGEKTHGYLVGVSSLPDVEEAFCSLDPFSYISHLSAMAWHGLTDRLPRTLFVTRPSSKLWRALSRSRLETLLGQWYHLYEQAKLPAYHVVNVQRLRNRPVNIWSSNRLDQAYQAAYKRVEDSGVRVATIGRCFLDMVREPNLCGGIYHVMEVFEEHGPSNVEKIIAEIDRHGNKLEKARAGYLLEEAKPSLVSDPVLIRWAENITRGGSRKLDPTASYSDKYSDRWAISINV